MSQRPATAPRAEHRQRCAIYTRKSSEEGLDQSFNSLDAQREACEAYVLSQTGEGWTALPTLYDDGGFSGGTIERPALKRLLADVALGKIDVVVVYKVDRLTRSLADFARIVDVLDANRASFVSVTQAFNTTSSMGRLTLNVLLSFAQFEREVTGERIRDKIAASKKKGMWMGGHPPLGYRPHGRTLIINEDEAQRVRHIFDRYLALRSVHALKDELAIDGNGPTTQASHETARQFSRGALYHLLSNRVYVGEIVHKDANYPGQHAGIIDRDKFEEVQQLLSANRKQRRERKVTVARAPLTGILIDSQGRSLSPASTRSARGRVYRYYVSARLQQGSRRSSNDDGLRLPAPALEALVLSKMQQLHSDLAGWEDARQSLVRVTIEDGAVTIRCKCGADRISRTVELTDTVARINGDELELRTPVRFTAWAGRTEIVRGSHKRLANTIDRGLVRGLARAHALVKLAKSNPNQTMEELAEKQSAAPSYIRRLSRLAFLAPDIQQAILEGSQPFSLNLEQLMRIDLPLNWRDQRSLLAFGDGCDKSHTFARHRP